MTTAENIPVLIVGAGPVGLTASLLLSRHGIRSILVERHPGTSTHPRARGFNFRTMEIYRELGLEQPMRAAGADLSRNRGLLIVETLAGAERARIGMDDSFYGGIEAASPTGWCMCTQNEMEPVLCEAAQKRGGDLRFDTEMVSFSQDAEGVEVLLRHRKTGEESVIRAQYLVAADGAGSSIRKTLDIGFNGPGTMSHNVNVYFSADLAKYVNGRDFILCNVRNQRIEGVFAAVNGRDLWQFFTAWHPDAGERLEDFTPERCVAMVRDAVGVADVAIEVKSVLSWEAAVRVADRFRDGRVLLAGDAVHQMPPAGAFGASTGIQDAHNLAWKLALVLQGQAGPSLLDSYEAERRPVALYTTHQAALRMREVRTAFSRTDEERNAGVEDTLVVTAGHRYESAAVLSDDGAPPRSTERLALGGHPGERMPHLWLEFDGQRRSTLDLLDGGFLLLAGPQGQGWCSAAQSLASPIGIKLSSYSVGIGGLVDADDRFGSSFGVDPGGAVLVRPDGVVAWRSASSAPEPASVLQTAFERLLAAGA